MAEELSRKIQAFSIYKLCRAGVKVWLDLDPLAKEDPGEGRHPFVFMMIAHVDQGRL